MLVKYSRASRFKWEKKDCAVRAFKIAFGFTYAETHRMFKKLGRKNKTATPWRTTKLVCRKLGIKLIWIKEDQPTVEKFVKDHPKGTYLVSCEKKGYKIAHMFPLIDGVAHDLIMIKPRYRVVCYSKIG